MTGNRESNDVGDVWNIGDREGREFSELSTPVGDKRF